MSKTIRVVIAGAVIAVLGAVTSALQAQTVRVVGTIEAVEGSTLVVKTRQGELKVNIASDVAVFGVELRTVSDIKLGQFLGVGAIPQPDGTQKAIRVQIFPAGESPNPGFRPWEGAPQGTMTNATVETSVVGVQGQELILKYKDGEKKIIVTPEAQIVGTVRGDKSELKPGAAISIARATKKPDGTLEANRISVGRDGIVPR
ncbi:MAG TPA: hypothetical protein VMH84_09120 [Xanthobacteraceae bacterium]|nr:hypothetical protein [Xanthobacteraceae bacterium]